LLQVSQQSLPALGTEIVLPQLFASLFLLSMLGLHLTVTLDWVYVTTLACIMLSFSGWFLSVET
jgi:hypothetical protein